MTVLPSRVRHYANAVGAQWGYGDASAQTMRQVADNVEAVLIERCGHYPAEERPAELAVLIKAFLQQR
jgi:pimeloyl-ACP methyl ester carboxylesterase